MSAGAEPASPVAAEPEPLRRELSRLAIAVLAINGLVGAGIFGLPAKAAALTGAFSPVIYLVCGILMSALVLCFAQASSYFRNTGGPILYTQTAFGPFVGFETGWMIYVGRVTSLAANANLLATYTAAFVPGIDTGWRRVALIAAVAGGFAVLNVVGVKQGMGSIMAITVLKFIPLVVLALLGLTYLRVEPFSGMPVPAYREFGSAVLLVFYAFIGFEGALVPAGEARNPSRDMPRALVTVAIIATVLYIAIQTVCVAVLPELAASKRPLADAAGVMLGGFGAVAVTVGAAVSILGNYAASVLSAPRMTYALARDGRLPAWFGVVHERFRTPHHSVLFYCGLAALLALPGTFESLAEMSSLARICGYALTVAALPRLRRRFGDAPDAVRLPGGPIIPVVAFVICAWLLTQVTLETVLVTASFAVAGALLYAFAGRRRVDAPPVERGDLS